jgi:DNA-binding CsgD family transcriptional regulator/tetratricopeptide (TPR) repeat protein
MPDLPGSLRLTSTFPFVGRSAELETLRAIMPRAEGEGRRVVLLGGESGAGKSRLVREFAGEAAAEGAVVLYGACDAMVHTPYGPFVEALDHLARTADPVELRAALGTGGGELTRLLPDLPLRAGELPPPFNADPDTERHRLHTAVTDLLAGISRRRPVLLVLEDAHWADAPTLLLLRHLARAAGNARLLLLASFRDTEADLPETLSDTLADLRRSDDVVRLRLPGLSGEEVAEFVRRTARGELDTGVPELARAISDLTAGNAFLVCELWRALAETQAVEIVDGSIRLTRSLLDLGTPESVREVVSQRLARLAPRTGDLLELAATAGAEFELDLVRRAAGLGEPELVPALDEAVRSGMVEELPGRTLAYGFTHELVRRALYDRLSALRRAELHLRVGEALEAAEGRSGRALADLAHHFTAAAPFGGARRGVEFNLLAARAAAAGLAFDEAAVRLRTALGLGIEAPRERAEAFLELGTACHRGGKALDALEAFTTAAGIARELGDAELLARAAIGYEEACWRPGIADQGAVELLEEAATLPGEQAGSTRQGHQRANSIGPELRVGLLSGLARALDYRGDRERGAIVRTSAVAMARRLHDRAGLAKVLARSYWSRGTTSLDEILDMLTEARDIGEELHDAEILTEAMCWRVPAFVVLCDIDSARQEIAALLASAEQTAEPFKLHVAEHYASAIALNDGRLGDAEAMAQRSHDWSRLLTGRDASGTHGIQMFSIRREQGRLAELAPVIRILSGRGRQAGPWRPGLVCLLVELGMEREARRELARIAAEGLDAFRESLWIATLAYLTDACAALGDEATAAAVYPELESLAGSNVMIGHLVACYGAADRYLGMLAGTLGERERAQEHFERAMELNRRMGAATWLAHTAFEYARLLLAQGPRERDRAGALLAEAAGLAERIGMPALLGRIRALGSSTPPPAGRDDLSPREVQILSLVAGGLSNREIGAILFISEHTAANHIRSILRKTGCANRTEAASYAHRHGLVEA